MPTTPRPIAWISAANGGLFDGTPEQFEDCFDVPATWEAITAWAANEDVAVTIAEQVPGPHTDRGIPFPVSGPELAVQLREHAVRALLTGTIDGTARVHLFAMADAVDGGVGAMVHHGCPDDTIPTAKCLECYLVLDAEISGGAEGRRGTVFDVGPERD